MRELTFVETGYVAVGLLLSLVLPLLMSFRGPRNGTAKRMCMRTLWTGQLLLTLAGSIVLISAQAAPYAAAFGVLSYMAFTFVMLRQCKRAASI